MKAEIEWLTESANIGVIRVFDSYGYDLTASLEPYVWAATVVVVGNVVEFKGVFQPPTIRQARAIKDECLRLGLVEHRRVRPRKIINEPDVGHHI